MDGLVEVKGEGERERGEVSKVRKTQQVARGCLVSLVRRKRWLFEGKQPLGKTNTRSPVKRGRRRDRRTIG